MVLGWTVVIVVIGGLFAAILWRGSVQAGRGDDAWQNSPANPLNPLSPLHPVNPASPFHTR